MTCKLALEDGTIFTGHAFGATGTALGEVVFNTSMTGYQEIFTDPSYCGQIVTMTYPLIGNYGVNAEDFESLAPHLAGFVVKELAARPSNFRATAHLPELLEKFGVVGITGIDTRALTSRIRTAGALNGVLSTEIMDDLELVRRARAAPAMAGANLVDRVAPPHAESWSTPLAEPAATPRPEAESPKHVVALDCGIKRNILRHLVSAGCRVTDLPGASPPQAIRDLRPDGILVGNGPGDPEAVRDTISTLADLIGEIPMFGICLGHQMLALALGAQTYKLRFGHHGANLPVRNELTGRVCITSQNHGFAVDARSLERGGATTTHVNLNDDSLEGFLHADKQLMAVQFHPEAGPGPHDASHLFVRFVQVLNQTRRIDHALFSDASESTV